MKIKPNSKIRIQEQEQEPKDIGSHSMEGVPAIMSVRRRRWATAIRQLPWHMAR